MSAVELHEASYTLTGSAVACHLVRVAASLLRVGKRVRRETAIGRGAVSISSVAVELARQALPDLERRCTVLLGAGHTTEAERFGGRATPLELAGEELRSADIVICSTRASHPIVWFSDVLSAIEGRRGRPLVLIDIAVPRDVEPAIRHPPGVVLRDIDGLEQVACANLSRRHSEARRAERIVAQQLQRFGYGPGAEIPAPAMLKPVATEANAA